MGLIKDFFEYRRALKNVEPEERSYNGGLIYSTLSSYSNEKAMQLSAFFCGVQLLSNAIATLPKQVVSYDNDEKHLVEHPLWYILNVKPNQKYNPFNMWHDILEMPMYISSETRALTSRNSYRLRQGLCNPCRRRMAL